MEEQKQKKPRASRRKEITKIRAELNDIETKSTLVRINKSRSWLFEKINKVDKHLARLTKEKRKKTQINKIRNERELITDTTEIQRIIQEHSKRLCNTKLGNLKKGNLDSFSRLNRGE